MMRLALSPQLLLLSLCVAACGGDDGDDSRVVMPAASPAATPAPSDDDDDDDDPDNTAACEDLAEELTCEGGVDIGMVLQCRSYGTYACDLAPYFDCIADAWSCDPAELDSAGLTSCAQKLSC